METEQILATLGEVCDFADKHYPSWEDRHKTLRHMGEELGTSIDDRQRRAMLKAIFQLIAGGGGIGSFAEISDFIPQVSNVAWAEIERHHRNLDELYREVKQALSE